MDDLSHGETVERHAAATGKAAPRGASGLPQQPAGKQAQETQLFQDTQSFRDAQTTQEIRPAGKKWPAGFWKKQARTWHWITGAICLVGMLLFSITGITLNHAAEIPASPNVTERTSTLPDELLTALADAPATGTTKGIPDAIEAHIDQIWGVSIGGRRVEWTEYDAYIALPRPGGDAWMSIDRQTGEILYEVTSRGAVSYLNDLHKGRNTGVVWAWFIDLFSVASILFCLTGLWLLQIHAAKRRSTWPLTMAGLLLPLLLVLAFVH